MRRATTASIWALLRGLVAVLLVFGAPVDATPLVLQGHQPALSAAHAGQQIKPVDELRSPARLSSPDEPSRPALASGAGHLFAPMASDLAVLPTAAPTADLDSLPSPVCRRTAHSARAPPVSILT